jgi:transcriptional regulator with XRE-family HTH domain
MFLVGEKIKDVLTEKNVKVIELAKLIDTSRQNVNGILKRKSLDSALLYKISNALQYNFFKHYVISNDESKTDNSIIRKLNITITNLETELEESQKEIKYLREITNLQRKQLSIKK